MKTLEDLVNALPAEGTPHECHAEKSRHCFVGSWKIHGPHDYSTWNGSIHCPGRTAETVLSRKN